MKRRKLLTLSALAALSGLALIPAAFATPPANVTGSWVILTDQTYTTLDIVSQSGPGAPGAAECRIINGNLGIAPVRGFYCPDSGHVHFLHNNLASNVTVRTFTGSVSEDANGAMHMAGVFNVLAVAFGDYGEYPFSANK